MMSRCYNKSRDNYKYYGGRGITVCDRWRNSVNNFIYDMKDSYSNHVAEYGEGEKNTSLDRVDVNGNYEPSNCKWSTMKEQANNRRNNTK